MLLEIFFFLIIHFCEGQGDGPNHYDELTCKFTHPFPLILSKLGKYSGHVTQTPVLLGREGWTWHPNTMELKMDSTNPRAHFIQDAISVSTPLGKKKQ